MNDDNKNRWTRITSEIPIEEIIEDLRKKVEEDPESSHYLSQLASLLYKQQRYEECIPYFSKLLDKGLRDPDILSSYGDALLEQGRHREAKTYFKEALGTKAHDPVARSGMVRIAEIEEQLAKVKKRFIKYASIASVILISLVIVSIVFTKSPFSFLTPNKLYQGIDAFYVGKTSGTLNIVTIPTGAKIYIDGKIEASTTPTEIIIKKGRYDISISKEDYENYSTAVDIEVGTTRNISTTLKKQILGALRVVTNPEGANVYIDGAYIGATPVSFTIETGTHNIEIIKEGYYDHANTVQIYQSEMNNLLITLQINPVLRFKIRDHVQASDNLNVRENPSVKGNIITVISKGSTGTILSNCISTDNYHWWKVKWNSGSEGWSAGEYLVDL